MAATKELARFSDEEVETALGVLALYAGNSRRAAAELKNQGLDIGFTTLHRWRTELHRERYDLIYAQVLPKVRERVAQRCEQLMESQADIAERMVERIDRELEDIPARELAGALRNVETAKAINYDKAALSRDRPTQITETKTTGTLETRLRRVFAQVVDGTAEEVDTSLPTYPHQLEGQSATHNAGPHVPNAGTPKD